METCGTMAEHNKMLFYWEGGQVLEQRGSGVSTSAEILKTQLDTALHSLLYPTLLEQQGGWMISRGSASILCFCDSVP